MHARWLSAMVGSLLSAATATATSLIDVDDNRGSFTGTWNRSTAILLFYGDDYAVAQGGGSSDRVVFENPAPFERDGRWCVQARWTAAPNRYSAAQFVVQVVIKPIPPILPGLGPFPLGTFTADMRTNGGAWQQLGCVNVGAGYTGQVVLTDTGAPASTFVVADAVRWVRDGPEPGIEFGPDGFGGGLINCANGVWDIRRSVTITVPARGYVFVHATGSVLFNQVDKNVTVAVGPGTGSPTLAEDYTQLAIPTMSASNHFFADAKDFALSKVFPAAGPGSMTCNLRACAESGLQASLYSNSLTALYVPNRY